MTEGFSSGIPWTALDAVIFDVDGTLFDHVALRRPMLARMLAHLLTGRLPWRDIRTLRLFRRERVRLALAEAANIGSLQYESVAAAVRRTTSEVEAIVTRWMYRQPLAFVARCAFPDAGRFIEKLKEHQIRTGVFSDYPAGGKLGALRIAVDVVRDATSPDVGRLKPSPHGFLRVADLLQVRPSRCLVIGDRDDRDGEAARRAGCMFLRKVTAFRRLRGREFTSYRALMLEVERHRRRQA
jgi:beta-phosphoglucomutase-like phosphatase (HAD superfamily)